MGCVCEVKLSEYMNSILFLFPIAQPELTPLRIQNVENIDGFVLFVLLPNHGRWKTKSK